MHYGIPAFQRLGCKCRSLDKRSCVINKDIDWAQLRHRIRNEYPYIFRISYVGLNRTCGYTEILNLISYRSGALFIVMESYCHSRAALAK